MVSQRQSRCLMKNRRDSFASCQRPRVNSQWSVWYCVFALAFQISIMVSSIHRFTRYVLLPWPPHGQPYFELNAYVAFLGAAVVLMPFFVISALMKVGNYANDGYKIGEEEPDTVVYQNLRKRNCCRWWKALWKHGGPIAPLIHLAASMCLLLPRLLIEAQLIKHGFISKGAIWRTDLDFLIPHKDRLVTLRFLATLNVTEVWGQKEDSSRLSLHPDTPMEEQSTFSSEFINYIIALTVYAIRYPAVFWNVNKSFGLLFSIYMLLTASQQLLTFAGFAVLYKVHICGPREVLLRFSPLLLSLRLATVSFLAYSVLLTLSGSVLYFYGLQKYKEWLDSRVQCQLIKWKQESRRLWGVAPHLSAFLCLITSAACAGPLMHDYTLVYCGSLDGAILAGVTGTITHIFIWIVLWLILTIKHRWKFTSLAITSDLQLNGFKSSGQEAPLLVIDHGQTYQVRETDSKKAILNVIQKSRPSLPKVSPAEDDDIYWLKPKPPPPKDLERPFTWHRSLRKSPGPKNKAIFQESLAVSSATCRRTRSLKKSPKVNGRFRKQNVKFEELSDSDDGDYATLKDMTVVREDGDGADGLLSKRPRPRNGNEVIRRDYENLEVHPYSLNIEEAADDEKHSDCESPISSHLRVPVSVHRQASNSTRRTDSGVSRGENGDTTPRSGSISDSSTSPEKGNSESSSGIHSSSSLSNKRASSMENMGLVTLAKSSWKSMSLQRGAVPPPVVTTHAKVFRSSNNPLVVHLKTNKELDDPTNSKVKPFERATNIRMTSFTDRLDFPSNVVNINYASKSIQNYPTVSVPTVPTYHTHQRRYSANYSLASSADSEYSVLSSLDN